MVPTLTTHPSVHTLQILTNKLTKILIIAEYILYIQNLHNSPIGFKKYYNNKIHAQTTHSLKSPVAKEITYLLQKFKVRGYIYMTENGGRRDKETKLN